MGQMKYSVSRLQLNAMQLEEEGERKKRAQWHPKRRQKDAPRSLWQYCMNVN